MMFEEICIDPGHQPKQSTNPMAMKQAVANRLSCAVSFAYLDICSGYWQLPADGENSKLLTLNTPWGQYRFTRLPFYISPAPEITKGR